MRKLTLQTWKPRTVQLPPIADGESTNPVDRILGQKEYKTKQFADDRTFVRRLFLDAGGVLPKSADVDAFVNDARENKVHLQRLP